MDARALPEVNGLKLTIFIGMAPFLKLTLKNFDFVGPGQDAHSIAIIALEFENSVFSTGRCFGGVVAIFGFMLAQCSRVVRTGGDLCWRLLRGFADIFTHGLYCLSGGQRDTALPERQRHDGRRQGSPFG